MGHFFYDILLIINVWLMQLKFYHGHHSEKYQLQCLVYGDFHHDIGILLLEDARYTSLDPYKILFYAFYFIFYQ